MAGVSTEVKRLEEYIDQSDWRVKANANQGYSVGGAILNVAGGAAAGFWFKQYGDEIANLHKDGDFYIHDLDYVSGYCCGHSLRSLLLEGFNGVEGKISSNPPKHLSSALNQMVNFLGTLQNEWAGAQAFSSVDTLLAPYVWIEREDIRKEFKDLGVDVEKDEIEAKIEETLKKRVHQQIQELIFNLSVSSRWGNQTVFSNFSFDIRPPKDLADKNPIVGGEPMDMVYADFQKEMDLLNITFCNVMYEGDRDGRIFSFPIPTYSMTKDFPYYSEVGDAIFRLTAKYGSPYFANYTNTTMSPEDARSMCPLTGDTEVLVRHEHGALVKPIKEMYDTCEKDGSLYYQVWDGEAWRNARPNCQGKQKYLILTLKSGETIKMGKHHLQFLPERKDSVEAQELKVGDFLAYDTNCPDGVLTNQATNVLIEQESEAHILNGYYCEQITDIKESDTEETLYCMEVDNENHLFTLGNGILTHNCRLRLDLRELKKRGGGLFGSSEQTGSIGVVTLNMARIGALYKTEEEMFKRVDYLMEMAKTSLLIKRRVITDLLERGFYPYTKRYLGSFNNFFNTIGVNGVNEMIENMTDKKENITTDFGREFAEKILTHINDRLLKYQQESGSLWNLEATPAEGATYKLAMSDKKKYGSEYVYYTNSTQLPTGFTDDPFLAIKMQENLQSLYTGGTVLHLYLSKALGNTDAQSRDLTRELVKRSISQSKLPYVSITPVFSVCPEHGYIYGEHAVCPKCGKKTEVWSRVMGYYRPRDSYNVGKRYEHDNKKLFDAELTQKELESEENLEPFKDCAGEEVHEAA